LRDRVVAELGCPPEQVVVTPFAAGGYHVVACGRRATFSCVRHEHYDHGREYAYRPYKDQCVREEPWTQ